jgi:hypothetical protein
VLSVASLNISKRVWNLWKKLSVIAQDQSQLGESHERLSASPLGADRHRRFLSEVSVFAIFFLLLFAATLAGVPEIARPMTTLDYVDALLSSFTMVFLFTLWVGKGIESGFVLHGALVGVVGILLFAIMWISTTRSLAPAFAIRRCSLPENTRRNNGRACCSKAKGSRLQGRLKTKFNAGFSPGLTRTNC